jgi:hypothetical protein
MNFREERRSRHAPCAVRVAVLLTCAGCAFDLSGVPTGEADGGPSSPPIALPFAVDDHFVASGYTGAAIQGALTMTPQSNTDDQTCAGDRPLPSAHGACHRLTYRTISGTGVVNWAGVVWLAHLDDWGMHPGVRVQQGARRVAFYAKGEKGGERVTFGAGLTPAGPYEDEFAKELTVNLSVHWTRYELDLTGLQYDAVVGGFRWSAAQSQTGELSFQVDDIRWE